MISMTLMPNMNLYKVLPFLFESLIHCSVVAIVSPTVTKIHTPIDLISQTTFMLTLNLPICSTQQESRPCWIVWKTHSVQFHALVEFSSDHHQTWST